MWLFRYFSHICLQPCRMHKGSHRCEYIHTWRDRLTKMQRGCCENSLIWLNISNFECFSSFWIQKVIVDHLRMKWSKQKIAYSPWSACMLGSTPQEPHPFFCCLIVWYTLSKVFFGNSKMQFEHLFLVLVTATRLNTNVKYRTTWPK